MYATLHSILAVYYGLLPVAGLLVALRGAARRQSAAPLVRFLVTCCSGIILGTALIILHSVLSRGHVPVWRIFQTWYFVIDLLLTLGILRWIAREGTWRLMRVRRDLAGWPIAPDSARASIAFIAQGILLTAIGLPLIAAAFMVHRLPVDSGLTPASAAGCVFQNVEFPATDGVAVAGWWVPAEPTASNPRDGRRTVLMAFDLGDDLPRQVPDARVGQRRLQRAGVRPALPRLQRRPMGGLG